MLENEQSWSQGVVLWIFRGAACPAPSGDFGRKCSLRLAQTKSWTNGNGTAVGQIVRPRSVCFAPVTWLHACRSGRQASMMPVTLSNTSCNSSKDHKDLWAAKGGLELVSLITDCDIWGKDAQHP
jgi:hypothetical protein